MTGQTIPCVIGIDGGGTRSTGFYVSLTGQVLARAEGGPLNYHTSSLTEFRRHLTALMDALGKQAPPEARWLRCVVGTAALFDRAGPAETRQACEGILPAESTLLLGDALVAVFGATAGQPGMLIVAGTGSIAVSLDGQGTFHTAGGFGPLIGGDPGSAFWLGSQAVSAAAQAECDRGELSPLGRAICDYFNVTHLREIVSQVYGATDGVRRLAGLAGFLARSELAQELPFLKIQQEAGRELAALGSSLLRFSQTADGRIQVFGSGSVLTRNEIVKLSLAKELERLTGNGVEVRSPLLGPAPGAALLALREAGQTITREMRQLLQSTAQ